MIDALAATATLAATMLDRPLRLLDPGTQVTAQIGGRTLRGVVQPYDQPFSPGTFPVRFEDGIWRKMAAQDVTVVSDAARKSR